MTEQEAEELYNILTDPVRFCSLLKIVTKGEDGEAAVVSLEPTGEQVEIVHALQQKVTTFILKPRQIGATTIILAFLFWLAYMAETPLVIVLMAHKEKPAKQLLKRIKFMYDNLPKFLQPPLRTSSTTELIFEHNGAGIYARGGQGDGGVRSETIHYMHITEINFTPHAEELLTTAKSAINNNPLILESTANHQGDTLYNEIRKYQTGKYKQEKYQYLFFSWLLHEEYQTDPAGYHFTSEERTFQQETGCTDSQLAWRQDKIAEFGYEKFIREYPISFEEAYRVTGNTYFTYKDFVSIASIPVDGTDWTRIEDPKEDDTYAIGVDVGGGVGRNYSVIYVVSKKTLQPVLIWRSNTVDPVQLAEYIVNVATRYNRALVLVESNNHGLATINELQHQGYTNLWKEDDKNFVTNVRTKTLIFSNLRKMVRGGFIQMIDERTKFEMLMVIDDNGIIKFGEENNSHCDHVMAKALAYWCLNRVSLRKEAFLPDWILKRKADSLRASSGATNHHRRY